MNNTYSGQAWRLAAITLGLAALACSALFALPDPAAAASDVGKNVGKEVGTWGKSLLLGAAALVGLPILFKRDLAGGAVVTLLVVLIGGFVFAPGAVKTTISSLWQAVGG